MADGAPGNRAGMGGIQMPLLLFLCAPVGPVPGGRRCPVSELCSPGV